MATGVQFDIGANALSRSARPFDAGNNVAESMSINGGITGASDLLLDGVPNTGTEGSSAANMGFVPPPEAVSEYKIQNSNYDAQYGRTSGGTMTVSVKSGTNQIHGAVYWLDKNTILTANAFDYNRIGTPRAAYHENNPGLEFDGPVVLPHVYDGRNKTFFMYSYEIWRDSIPTPSTQTLPYPAAVAGNFNTTLQSNGSPITIYDPNTTALSGTTYLRQPFPGDIIPSTRMNAVGVKIASYIPAPNLAGATNNFVTTPNARTDAYDSHVIRIDQQISEKNHFFSRFVRGFRTETNGDYGWQQVAAPGNSYSDGRLNQGGNADLTTVLSPSTVLTSRLGYFRHDLWITLYASGFNPTTLGFPSSLLRHSTALLPHHRREQLPGLWGLAQRREPVHRERHLVVGGDREPDRPPPPGEMGRGISRESGQRQFTHHQFRQLLLHRRLDATKRADLQRRRRQLDCLPAAGHAE